MSSLYLLHSTTTLLSKHTPFLSDERRSHLHRHSLRVSASATSNRSNSNNDTTEPKLERRNMLLGLGGLYGAANLISTQPASANPVQAPELDKCKQATNLNNKKLLENDCCPPMLGNIVDYQLPPVYNPRTRRSAHRLSRQEVYKYNLAIKRMKELPEDDPRSFMAQANIHCAYCNGAYDQPGQGRLDIQVHNSWLFFPFHRWYLYFYERILGKLINDPTFALPFWNWDNFEGMTIPPIFNDPNSAIYDPKRNKDNLTAVVDLGRIKSRDPMDLVANNLTLMYSEMIRSVADVYDFMGKPYREGTPVDPGAGSSERGSHVAVHIFVGDPSQPSMENMGNFYSAGRDPLFYCHHANVDRMWYLFKDVLPNNKVPDGNIRDPDFLNANFLFYDENGQLVRVYVRDCLDVGRMGYKLELIELPWVDYRPPRKTALAKIAGATAPMAETLFPLNLDRVVRFQVKKTKKGDARELLVIEDIMVDTTKFLKFDVFVNDEDDDATEFNKAAFAGTYAQVPHKAPNSSSMATSSIRLKLTELYKDMDIADDDTIVVTIVPRHEGPGVTIGGIKIIEDPTPPPKSKS